MFLRTPVELNIQGDPEKTEQSFNNLYNSLNHFLILKQYYDNSYITRFITLKYI